MYLNIKNHIQTLTLSLDNPFPCQCVPVTQSSNSDNDSQYAGPFLGSRTEINTLFNNKVPSQEGEKKTDLLHAEFSFSDIIKDTKAISTRSF